MKNVLLVAAGLALCFSLPAVSGHAGTPAALSIQNSHDQPLNSVKTFTGTVTKQGDIFVLSDKADKTNYQLDDPKKVSDYVGKAVKVTGTLDAENLTIHVETITEIA